MGRSIHYKSPSKLIRNAKRLVSHLQKIIVKLNYDLKQNISNFKNIPVITQIDGCSLDVSTTKLPQNSDLDVSMSKQCDNCLTVFETEEQREQHDETHQFGCEDCGICFTSKYYADLHELAKHPGTFYALNYIPHSTKLQFDPYFIS